MGLAGPLSMSGRKPPYHSSRLTAVTSAKKFSAMPPLPHYPQQSRKNGQKPFCLLRRPSSFWADITMWTNAALPPDARVFPCSMSTPHRDVRRVSVGFASKRSGRSSHSSLSGVINVLEIPTFDPAGSRLQGTVPATGEAHTGYERETYPVLTTC